MGRRAETVAAAELDAALRTTPPPPAWLADEWGIPEHAYRARRPHLGTTLVDKALAKQDARLYRCPGCGEWRYRYRLGRWHQAQPPCPGCGHE